MVDGQDAMGSISTASVAVAGNTAVADRRSQLETNGPPTASPKRGASVDPIPTASRPYEGRCILRLDAKEFASGPIDHPIGKTEVAVAAFSPEEATLHTGLFDLRRSEAVAAKDANAYPTIWTLDRLVRPTHDAVFGLITSQTDVGPTPDMVSPASAVSVLQV